jgi:hypothetical protein
MTEREPKQKYTQNNETHQFSDTEEAQLPEEVTTEFVRRVLLEIDLECTYEEMLDAYEATEEDFIIDAYQFGEGQMEERDSIETIIEIGLYNMAFSLGLA